MLEIERKVRLFKLSSVVEQGIKIGGLEAIEEELKSQIWRQAS